jgi:hypothetical protein
MAHSVWSPKDVNIAWNVLGAITGFADDTFVVLSRNTDMTEETVGADGTLATTRNADRTGSIAITLMQTAESNILLSAVANAQEKATKFLTGALTITDPSGSVLAVATGAYLKAMPEVTLGSGQNSKEWMFFCEGLEYTSVPEGISQELQQEIDRVKALF